MQITISIFDSEVPGLSYLVSTQLESNQLAVKYFSNAIDLVNYIHIFLAVGVILSLQISTSNAEELRNIFHVYNIL